MKPIRAFFAIDLDEKTRTIIKKLIDLLKETSEGKKVRWIWSQNLHITVRFLGDIQPAQILSLTPRITKEMHRLPPFRIELCYIGLFPSKQKPYVVAIELAYSSPLQNLFSSIENSITAAGFPPEARPTRPHLTIGRLHSKAVPDIYVDLSTHQINMLVSSVTLYQSEGSKRGPVYTPLDRIKLNA